MVSPVILIGLPRSGSTLLSRVINESLNCFLINDFYYLQYVDSINGYRRQDSEAKALMVDFVVDQLRNRTRPADLDDEVWFGLPFSEAQLAEIDQFASSYKADSAQKNWAQILNDIMTFGAQLSGKPIWGYNTPQDYLNVDAIVEQFPDAKFVFLLRSPLKTLLSYKYYWTVIPKFRNERGRYHPVIQSLAWKTCVNSYLALKQRYGDSRFTLVKFEEFISDPDKVIDQLSQFAGLSFLSVDISQFGHNSSMKKDAQGVKVLTSLEEAICRSLTKKERTALNYEISPAKKASITDVADLAVTTGRNAVFYLSQFIFSKDVRKRMLRFAKKLAATES